MKKTVQTLLGERFKDSVRGSPTGYGMLNSRPYDQDISFCPQTLGDDVWENIQSDNFQAETSLLEKETLVHLFTYTLNLTFSKEIGLFGSVTCR